MSLLNTFPLLTFQKLVSSLGSQTALVKDGLSLSFSELDQESNQVAHLLSNLGVKQGQFIGIMADREIATIVSILATWKLGAAFVPLNPANPPHRLKNLIQQCDISIIIGKSQSILPYCSHTDFKDLVFISSNNKNEIDSSSINYSNPSIVTWEKRKQYSQSFSFPKIKLDDVSCILFTSGSTGDPKGVPVTVEQLSFYNNWVKNQFPITATDRILNTVNFTFDASLHDLCFLLGCGLEFHIYDAPRHPRFLSDYILTHNITVLTEVPTTYQMLFDSPIHIKPESLKSVKLVFTGGSSLPAHLLKEFDKFMPQAEIYNMYGTTETMIVCAWHKFSKKELRDGLQQMPISEFLPDHELYLVDDTGTRVTSRGELVVGGPQIMTGYWRNTEATKKAIRQNSSSKYREYLTGDLAEYDEQKRIIIIGRKNETIKTAGYRVDLGEIESILTQHESVSLAAALALPDTALENKIIAFVTLRSKSKINSKDLILFCKQNLLPYVVPHQIKLIESMPLNNSGKVDKIKLRKLYLE